MNIYHPYDVLADTADCLHLKESENRERVHFATFRILPIFMLFFMWFVLQQVGSQIPMGWNYILIGIALLVTALLFFKTYITEIKIIPGKEIFFIQKTVGGTKEVTISVGNIQSITLMRRKGKSIGAFFTLHTKTKKSYLLLSIPGAYVDEHHISLLRERLQDVLQIKVSGK